MIAAHLKASDAATDATPGTDGLGSSRLGRRDALLLVAIVLVAIDLRPGIISIGPLLPLIISDFDLSHAYASLLVTVPDLLMGLLALPAPWLARRFGRDAVVMAALVLLWLAMTARAFALDSATLLLTTAGVGAGIAIAGALFAGLIKARFPARIALVMGLYSTAISLGSTVSAAATGPIAQASSLGWRLGSGIWAVLGVVAIAAWALVMSMERRAIRLPRREMGPPARLPLRNPIAWAVAVFFACVNLLFYALISWTAPMYQEAGMTPATAGLILASFTAAFMCVSPVVGWLSRSTDRRGWLALCAGIAIVGLTGLAFAPTWMPFLWVPVSAVGLGGAFTLGMTLPLDNTHSVDEANTWNAFVLTVGYLIAAAGPVFVGSLRDLTGSFSLPFSLLILIAVAMLAITPFLRPRIQAG